MSLAEIRTRANPQVGQRAGTWREMADDVLFLLAEVERLRKIEEAASELVAVIPVTYTEATNQQIWERAYSLREILRASSHKTGD